jgi:hypothetical protein
MKSLHAFTLGLGAIFVASVTQATELPDMIRCNQTSSNYQLVLILRSPQLPLGVSAIGLKDGTRVVFKVASQMFTVTDEPHVINFNEVPATTSSKAVKLDLQTKVATLLNFSAPGLENGSAFICRF